MKYNVKILLSVILLPIIIIAAIGIYNHLHSKLEKQLYPLPEEYLPSIEKYSAEYDVPIELVCAVINTESSFDPMARSHADAIGIMQITIETFDWLQYRMGIEGTYSSDKLYDYDTNVKFGTYFLSLLYMEFRDWDTALAAYNAGRGNVIKWLADANVTQDGKLVNIPFEETRNYIQKVNKAKAKYTEMYFKNNSAE